MSGKIVNNFTRQMSFVPPEKFDGITVSIIGVGAVGSNIALQLAQMGFGRPGCGHLHLYDYDIVEEHNLPNQAFLLEHIGMKKVDAMRDLIQKKMGFTVEAHDVKVTESMVDDPSIRRSHYVFLAVDSMKARKEIFTNFLQYNTVTRLMLESRMGATDGMVFCINPQGYTECEVWNDKWYSDKESVAGGCGTSASVGVTTTFLAAYNVSTMMHHFRAVQIEHASPSVRNELLIELNPFGLISMDYKNKTTKQF